jgi:hypothetical protein
MDERIPIPLVRIRWIGPSKLDGSPTHIKDEYIIVAQLHHETGSTLTPS